MGSVRHDRGLVTHVIRHLHRRQRYSEPDGVTGDDLQRCVWRFLGAYTMALSSRDSTAQHPSEGCQSQHSYELGLQLASWRDDADLTRVDQVAFILASRILLCRQFCCR